MPLDCPSARKQSIAPSYSPLVNFFARNGIIFGYTAVVERLLEHSAGHNIFMYNKLTTILGKSPDDVLTRYQVRVMQAVNILTQHLPRELVTHHIGGFLRRLEIVRVGMNVYYYREQARLRERRAYHQRVASRIFQALTLTLMFCLHVSDLNNI